MFNIQILSLSLSLSQREFWCSRSNSTFIYIYFQFFSPKVNLDVQHPNSTYFLLFFLSKRIWISNIQFHSSSFLFLFFLFFFNMKSECAIFKFLTLSLSLYEKKMKALFILSFLLSRRALDNTKRNTIRAFTLVRANFLSILHEKTYSFYFTLSLLQNTHISSSILQDISIKYSLLSIFFIISLNHLSFYALSLSFYPFFCFVALSLHPSLWPLLHQITSGLPLPNHKTHPPSSSTTIKKSQPPPNLNHTLTLTHQIRSTTKSQSHSHYPPQSSPTPTTHH